MNLLWQEEQGGISHVAVSMIIMASLLTGCRNQPGQCGGRVPLTPAMNAFAISYDPTKVCTDAPLIDAKVEGANGRDGRFAQSQGEHDKGILAEPGNEITVSIFFDNSSADLPQNVAINVHAVSTISSDQGLTHRISVKLVSDNTPTVGTLNRGGDIVVRTNKASALEYVPETTSLCITRQEAIEKSFESNETCGLYSTNVLVRLPDSEAPGTIRLGDIQPGFSHCGDVDFKLRVVKIPATLSGHN